VRPTRASARATFSRLVSAGSSDRPKRYNRRPIARTATAVLEDDADFGVQRAIATPSSAALPVVVARSRPAVARGVDLPQPEPPMMATISPGSIPAVKRSSALTQLG
jgi:hypothetical protein